MRILNSKEKRYGWFRITAALFFVAVSLVSLPGLSVSAQDPTSSAIHETLNNFDDAFQQLKDERDALRQEIDNLKVEQRALVDGVRKKIEVAEEEKQRYSQELEVAQDKIVNLEEEKQDLSGKVEETVYQVNRYNEVATTKDTVLAEARNELEQLKLSFSEAEKALEKAAARIQKLQVEKEALESELESNRSQRKKILFGYDDDLAVIKEQREILSKHLKEVEAKLKTAEDRLSKTDEYKEGLRRKHKEELNNLSESLKTAEDMIKDLGSDKKLAEHKISLSEEKLKLNEDKIAALEKDIAKSLKSARDKLKSTEDDLKSTEQKVLTSEEKLKDTEHKLTQELKTAESDKQDLLKKEQEYQKDIAVYKEKILAGEEKLQAAGDNMKFSEGKLSEANEKLSSAENRLQDTEHKLTQTLIEMDALAKRHSEVISALRKERTELTEKLEGMQAEISKIMSKLTDTAASKKDQDELVKKYQGNVSDISDAFKASQEAIAKLKDEKIKWEAVKKEYKADTALIDQAKGLKAQNDSLLKMVSVSEAKVRKMLDTYVKLQQENEQLKGDPKVNISPREFKSATEKNEELEKENQRLSDALGMKEEAAREIAKEAVAQKQKIKRMDSHLESWDSEKQQLTKQEQEAKGSLRTKEQRIDELSLEFRKTVQENENLKSQVADFPKKLASLNAKLEKFEKDNALLHYNLGVIYTEKEAYDDAVSEFEKALEIRPDDQYANYNLGIIYSQYVVDEDKAVKHFKKFLQKAPSDKDADMARRYIFTRESYGSEK